jgi:hypothetical protein
MRFTKRDIKVMGLLFLFTQYLATLVKWHVLEHVAA